jgi:hypothetical protein
METIINRAVTTNTAFLVPHPQWDREPIDNVRVTRFPEAQIADFRKLFSRVFSGQNIHL